MTSKIRDQILAIRDTGLTNMFDKNMVQRLAFERDMHELVLFLEEDIKEYVKFIMYGDTPSLRSTRRVKKKHTTPQHKKNQEE